MHLTKHCSKCATPAGDTGGAASLQSQLSKERANVGAPGMGDDISAGLYDWADGARFFGGVHGAMRIPRHAATRLPLRAQLRFQAGQQRRTRLLQSRLRLLWQPCTACITSSQKNHSATIFKY